VTGPTVRQRMVLQAIQSHRASFGCSPTHREICETTGIGSTNGVHDHLRALERKGLVDLGADGRARQVRLTARGKAAISDTPDRWLFAEEIAIEALDLSA
jgi:repressor LexA